MPRGVLECTEVAYVPGTFWHARFGHLVTYGAGYYSYLYAKVFAAHIWARRFEADPLNREAGELLRRGLLEHGNARDPRSLIAGVLGGEEASAVHYLRRELGTAFEGQDSEGSLERAARNLRLG